MKDARNPLAGGPALAVGALVGGLWGVNHGQAIYGLGLGLGIGAAVAVLVWLVDRSRR